MFNLTGKLALVTGATGGIGQSIVKALANQGAKVIMVGRNEEKLQNLKQELSDKVYSLICDFNDDSQINSLIENAEKQF